MMDDLEQELWSPKDLEEDNYSSDNNSTTGRTQPSLPLANPMCVETHTESGFQRSTRICLEQIREAMLHHRWQEAAEYMASYNQILEDSNKVKAVTYKELVWRMSTEILHHHPNSTMEDYNIIYERMKHSGVRHYLMISMEHSFHLLLHGQIEDAKRNFSAVESWRHGKESTAQYQKIKLIQAYRSLLDYIIWCDKTLTNTGDTEYDDNPEKNNDFRQASVNLKEILKNPGVWDPFILSYVEMLEFYNDHEEAVKVLEDYAYDNTFPPNPNAHVYLYQYLQRQNASERKLMEVLKILHALVPSHELMLEYSSLLLLSGKIAHVQTALGVVLDLLDYTCWKRNLDVWQRLKTIINKLQIQYMDDWEEVVSEKMAERKGWWPALHFTRFHASEDAPQLMEVKASLTQVLCPDQTLKYSTGSRE